MKTLFILALLFTNNLYAKLTASVDRTQMVVGEIFTLTISIDDNTNEQPDLNELKQVFQVLGNSQSSSTKIINGSYSIEKTWQISLLSNGIGNNIIPPIKVGNQSTKPIQITVAKTDPNAKANGDIFVEVSADKTSAYVKEQIILTVKLFYGINLSEGNLSEPTAKNTIVTQLDKGATYSTNRDGRNYTVVERHWALFAEKNGTLDLNSIIFNGRDNTSRRNFSMFSTGKPVRAVSKQLSFEIKPIPQDAIGKDWIPASNVQVSQEWSKPPYKVGEPITRTIILFIEGLSETQIPDIDLGEIENVRVYPEQPQTQTEKTPQRLKSVKQVKIALIPTQSGAIQIPEYQLQWFNTKTQELQFVKLPPNIIQVEAGEFALQPPPIENAILPNKQTRVIQNDNTKPEIKIIEKDNSLWRYLTAIFALLWLMTLFIFFYKRNKQPQPKLENRAKIISKNQILYAIENRDIKELQKVLISWWNNQYKDKSVTNLAQIKQHVNNSMQILLTQLESQLYIPESASKFDKEQWQKQVKSKGLDLITLKKHKAQTGLPELYR